MWVCERRVPGEGGVVVERDDRQVGGIEAGPPVADQPVPVRVGRHGSRVPGRRLADLGVEGDRDVGAGCEAVRSRDDDALTDGEAGADRAVSGSVDGGDVGDVGMRVRIGYAADDCLSDPADAQRRRRRDGEQDRSPGPHVCIIGNRASELIPLSVKLLLRRRDRWLGCCPCPPLS